ncbi:hypothetical protein [Marinobacter sp. X15-166B]|uniref:hypothetical protein n=1 Tax=Marinobacter sp. X15-166B TaxID=1897620 RepID=UPI00085C9167|nr:hypothetical protein [Marinobacter sp. X15-166B]OEY66794.1 hypothetical protein BG841_10235 [Marinobacter sp. X15-166B]
MTYAPEADPLAVVLDLGTPYSPVTDPLALDFDLAAAGTGFVYRKPPLAVGHRYLSAQARPQLAEGRLLPHADGLPRDGRGRQFGSTQAHGLALPADAKPWGPVPPKDARGRQFSGHTATPLDLTAERAQWGEYTAQDDASDYGAHAWDKLPARDTGEVQGFNVPPAHDVASPHTASDSILNWQPPPPEKVELQQTETLNLHRSPYTPPGALVVDFELVPKAILVAPIIPTRSVDSQPDIPAWSLKDALDGLTVHPWDRKPRIGTEVEFPSAIEPDAPLGEPPEEPENKRTYIIMNASSLIEVSTNTPLDFKDLRISLDADSFVWSMSCTIMNRASMNQIRPTADGPAEVDATVNGHTWRFIVESYRLDRTFARETYQISGVSRAQLLAAPYAPKRTGRVTSQSTATQVMTDQLQYTGFSIVRQQGLSDYVIPSGAWGWNDKTAMEVVAELARAQGAIVVPDQDTDELHIKHRYKQLGPWDYDAQPIEFIDAILQDTLVISYASQWEPQPEYNAVFVSGITDGVAVDVVRRDTAGDKAAPDIFDDLNVEATQCRERGMTAIAAGGDQEIVTIETVLPTSGSPGLIEPAMVIEYRDTQEPANTWRGNVLSVSVGVSKPGTGRVIQTIKVERHHYQ